MQGRVPGRQAPQQVDSEAEAHARAADEAKATRAPMTRAPIMYL
jgi:hypothetical protein